MCRIGTASQRSDGRTESRRRARHGRNGLGHCRPLSLVGRGFGSLPAVGGAAGEHRRDERDRQQNGPRELVLKLHPSSPPNRWGRDLPVDDGPAYQASEAPLARTAETSVAARRTMRTILILRLISCHSVWDLMT